MNSVTVSQSDEAKMNAQYDRIKAACKRRGYSGIPDRLKPRLITERVTERHAKSETAETVDLAKTNDSILDEEANVDLISPMLARCTGAEVEGHSRDESKHFMTRAEREQAASDLWRYRHPENLWIAPVSLFSPVARLTA